MRKAASTHPEASYSATRTRRTWRPILALLVGAPFIAECVASANTPTVVFLNPVVLTVLAMLYGGTALLLREAWVRGRIGFVGALVWAGAFTALNEGVVSGVLFKADALGLPPEGLGRQSGTNWALVVDLSWFHGLFGLAVPIALAELTFPSQAARPWLRRRGITFCIAAVLLVGIAAILPKDGTSVPDLGPRLTTLAFVPIVAMLALWLPKRERVRRSTSIPSPRGLAFRGALLSFSYGLIFFGLPHLAPRLTVLAGITFVVPSIALLRRWTRSEMWSRRHAVWLIGGLLVPSMLVSLPRLAALQPVSTVAFALYLLWLARRTPATEPARPPSVDQDDSHPVLQAGGAPPVNSLGAQGTVGPEHESRTDA
ncbi:MAG: hypothetical protein QOJ90_518 [Actinomycetota bacterium]|jgi:hypothetical protein|nr:hypothetical protein [Actinomycetota bacterium]